MFSLLTRLIQWCMSLPHSMSCMPSLITTAHTLVLIMTQSLKIRKETGIILMIAQLQRWVIMSWYLCRRTIRNNYCWKNNALYILVLFVTWFTTWSSHFSSIFLKSLQKNFRWSMPGNILTLQIIKHSLYLLI